jgi:hypothetical protein
LLMTWKFWCLMNTRWLFVKF